MVICTECGYAVHADLNTADDIRERGIKFAFAGGAPVTACQGTNLGLTLAGAEPGAVRAGHGSGNEKTGTSPVEGAK